MATGAATARQASRLYSSCRYHTGFESRPSYRRGVHMTRIRMPGSLPPSKSMGGCTWRADPCSATVLNAGVQQPSVFTTDTAYAGQPDRRKPLDSIGRRSYAMAEKDACSHRSRDATEGAHETSIAGCNTDARERCCCAVSRARPRACRAIEFRCKPDSASSYLLLRGASSRACNVPMARPTPFTSPNLDDPYYRSAAHCVRRARHGPMRRGLF